MAVLEKTSLERAAFPEEAGVSSKAIAEYIEDLIENDIEAHSIMILRRGKVAFECWREPYGPDNPHTLYSVSKSFTSTAIGFAIEEGLLGLDTRVIDIFPEYKPAKPDANLEKLTVFHLLTMSAGKDVSLLAKKSKNQWIKDFFDGKWKFAPGESWRYVNENIYMLSAVINRVTGISMLEYLTPRLFKPLGIHRKLFWETDGNGIEAGAWGLYLTTEEFAKFMLCFSQNGKYNSKQVIPARWIKEAVKKQVSNENKGGKDTSVGYGFCFWRNSVEDSYRADGMFGQYGIVFENYDAVFIITSCETRGQKSRNLIWKHFPEGFIEETPKPSVTVNMPALPALPELPPSPRSPAEKDIEGRYILIKNRSLFKLFGLPVSMFTIPLVFLSNFKGGSRTEVRFAFRGSECSMSWSEGPESNTAVCGMDGTPRQSRVKTGGMDMTVSGTAAWKNENTLNVWLRPLETVCQQRFAFIFNGNKVRLIPVNYPGTEAMLQSVSSTVKRVTKNPLALKLVDRLIAKGNKLVEAPHRGKITGS